MLKERSNLLMPTADFSVSVQSPSKPSILELKKQALNLKALLRCGNRRSKTKQKLKIPERRNPKS